MVCAGHVAHMRNEWTFLVRDLYGTRSHGRPLHIQEDHIELDVIEIRCGWIGLAVGRDKGEGALM